jgi:hypothetical protein
MSEILGIYIGDQKIGETTHDKLDLGNGLTKESEGFEMIYTRKFYFKINKSKIDSDGVLFRQLKIVIKRIKEIYNINHGNVNIEFGYDGDDFIKNKITLCIKIDYSKQK